LNLTAEQKQAKVRDLLQATAESQKQQEGRPPRGATRHLNSGTVCDACKTSSS
jgi:hypothetical protein